MFFFVLGAQAGGITNTNLFGKLLSCYKVGVSFGQNNFRLEDMLCKVDKVEREEEEETKNITITASVSQMREENFMNWDKNRFVQIFDQ